VGFEIGASEIGLDGVKRGAGAGDGTTWGRKPETAAAARATDIMVVERAMLGLLRSFLLPFRRPYERFSRLPLRTEIAGAVRP
jgi:hypothetical protein